jgi:hypothetical protein
MSGARCSRNPGRVRTSPVFRRRAVGNGQGWVLTGQKVQTTLTHVCDHGLVVARTYPRVPKHSPRCQCRSPRPPGPPRASTRSNASRSWPGRGGAERGAVPAAARGMANLRDEIVRHAGAALTAILGTDGMLASVDEPEIEFLGEFAPSAVRFPTMEGPMRSSASCSVNGSWRFRGREREAP